MSLPRWQEPNLARAPFVNERPVRRLAVTLWLLFAIVGGLGAWQSVSSRQETGARVAELVRLSNETASARERAAGLERDLRRDNLPAQNERTEFLNRRLAERAFSWSNLLESLTQAMPRGVRLVNLSPEEFASERLRAGAKVKVAATTRVAMRISGEAEETEDLLDFIDRLFQHPAFERPNLAREAEKKDMKIQFELTVAYLPEVAGQLAAGTLADGKPVGASARQPEAALGLASSSVSALPAAASPASAPAAGVPAAGKAAAASATPPAPPAQSVAAGGKRPFVRADADAEVATAGRDRAAADDAESPAGGRDAESAPLAGRDLAGVPATAAPGRGGGLRPGSTAPTAPAAGGVRFPESVMPTPLRPYASSTGGGG